MKNKMSDLRNTLFEMVERINDDDLTDDELSEQLQKAKAITGLAKEITATVNLELETAKFVCEEFGMSEKPQGLFELVGDAE
jgi:hypothetical protein